MSLADVLATHRVVVTVGSGGVGKTTTAAALALHAARQGRRVLCLTIDPARRLAQSLGLTEMTTEEQEVPPELFAAQGLEPNGGALSAMMLDTKGTFDDLIRRTASSEEAAERILSNDVYQYMSTSLAGTSEYMAMEKLYAVKDDPRFDLIVLDTPPTSNALDFLDAPERLAELIDSPAMRWFVQAFEAGGKLSFNLLSKGAAMILRGLSQFTGAGFLDVVAEFVSDFNELFGGFRERAEAVSGSLRQENVAFVIVTSPSALAVEEAIFFAQRLEEAGMRRDGFVVNGVRPLLAEPSADDATLSAELAPHLEGQNVRRVLRTMRRALDDARTRAVADRIATDRLRQVVRDGELFLEVPHFESDVHDLAALAQVGAYLVGERVVPVVET